MDLIPLKNHYNARLRLSDFERDTVELGVYDIFTVSILPKQSFQLKRATLQRGHSWGSNIKSPR